MPYHLAKSPHVMLLLLEHCLRKTFREAKFNSFCSKTPRVGLEPTTTRLTAECSTIELSRIIYNKTTYWIRCLFTLFNKLSKLHTDPIFLFDQALDRLVTVSSMRCRTSTSALSTLYSSRGLTPVGGISHLEGGFTLRCLQRLSLPDLATLPCLW